MGNLPERTRKQDSPKNISSVETKPTPISPTAANVAYGQHPRQVLDFWQAKSDVPTPVVFFIHGGGWMSGDKSRVTNLQQYLDAGISVVSINYRYVSQAVTAGVSPPVKAPLHDAARALQFVRSKSSEWNMDKTRIGASGGSAGACSSLWLAFHDDLAEKDSSDPVARESTRLYCAAVTGAQTTLDPVQMRKWIPNSRYGSHAFGIFKSGGKQFQQDFDAFYARRDELADWINDYSPYSLVTKEDAPVYLFYEAAPAIGRRPKTRLTALILDYCCRKS